MSSKLNFTIPKRSAAASATYVPLVEVTTATITAVYPPGPTIVPSSPISGKKRTPLESPPVTPGTVYVGACACTACMGSPWSPWDPKVEFSPIEGDNNTSAVHSPVKETKSFLTGLTHLCPSPSPTPPRKEVNEKTQRSSHDRLNLHAKRLNFDAMASTPIVLREPLSLAHLCTPPVIKRGNKCEKNCPVGDCKC